MRWLVSAMVTCAACNPITTNTDAGTGGGTVATGGGSEAVGGGQAPEETAALAVR